MLPRCRDEVRFTNPLADIGDDTDTYDVEQGASSPKHINFEEEQREQHAETQQQT